MNAASRERRTARHAAQKKAVLDVRVPSLKEIVGGPDLTPPRLAWLGGKSYPQSGDSRKARPGRKIEHTAALKENLRFDVNAWIANAEKSLSKDANV
jgi:hypothetical protein